MTDRDTLLSVLREVVATARCAGNKCEAYVVGFSVIEQARAVLARAETEPQQQLADELALVAKMGDTLKQHFPATMPNGDIICACAAVFHPVDAKAWHRHAASMVANTIAEATT